MRMHLLAFYKVAKQRDNAPLRDCAIIIRGGGVVKRGGAQSKLTALGRGSNM